MAAKKKKKGRGKNRSKGPCGAGHVRKPFRCPHCKGKACAKCNFTGLAHTWKFVK